MKRGKIAYSEAELAFLWARRSLPRAEMRADFVSHFGRTDVGVPHIKALCTRNGWATGREGYSPRDDDFLREHFSDTPTAYLAADLQRPVTSVSQRAARLGLKKSAEYLASPAAGRLQRGNSVGASAWASRISP